MLSCTRTRQEAYTVCKLLQCLQNESLILSQHEYILDTFLQRLPWHQEERAFSLKQQYSFEQCDIQLIETASLYKLSYPDELLLSKLRFATGIHRVDNYAILAIGDGGYVDHANYFLVHARNVSLSVRHFNQPFFPVLS